MALLLPDAPVVVWWPGAAPEDPGTVAARSHRAAPDHRRLDRSADPHAALRRARRSYTPGDTDFAWTRLTLWRAQLAAVLDQPPYEPVTGVQVTGAVGLAVDRPARGLARLQLERAGATAAHRARATAARHPRRAPRPRDRRRSSSSRDVPGVATLRQPSQPDARHRAPPPHLRDCLAEELRRLDPDELFGEVITERPGARSATRSVDGGSTAMTNERRVLVHPDKASLAGERRGAVPHQDARPARRRRRSAHVVLDRRLDGHRRARRRRRLARARRRRLVARALLVGRRALAARAGRRAQRDAGARGAARRPRPARGQRASVPALRLGTRRSTRRPTPTRPTRRSRRRRGSAHPSSTSRSSASGPTGTSRRCSPHARDLR